MKKVSGCIDVRPLGRHDFEFYVEDDTTEEEIKELVDGACDYFITYKVDPGYDKVTRTEYIKTYNGYDKE